MDNHMIERLVDIGLGFNLALIINLLNELLGRKKK